MLLSFYSGDHYLNCLAYCIKFVYLIVLICSHLCITLVHIFMRKRELVAILLLSSWCIVPASVPWLFLAVPWIGQLCVIVVFLGHTHLFIKITDRLLLKIVESHVKL